MYIMHLQRLGLEEHREVLADQAGVELVVDAAAVDRLFGRATLGYVCRMVQALLSFKVAITILHDRNLYTTTNKCLQCLIKMMYTVF